MYTYICKNGKKSTYTHRVRAKGRKTELRHRAIETRTESRVNIKKNEAAHFTSTTPIRPLSLQYRTSPVIRIKSDVKQFDCHLSHLLTLYFYFFFSSFSLCISHSFFCVRCCLKTIFLTISISNIYTHYKYMHVFQRQK